MQKVTFSTILIGVSDLNKARPFYEKVFGLKFDEFRPPFASATLGDIEFNIEENADYRSPDWAQKNIGTRKSCTFRVEDIFVFMKDAVTLGATVVHGPMKQHWGWYDGVIADSDGNEFVIEQEAN
ncbi:MAG: VOC family protein [Patescibacteria group bacterium]